MIKKIVLTAIALVSFLAVDAQAAISEDVVKESIVKHSVEMGVDPALALSIAKKESGFKHELKSISCKDLGIFNISSDIFVLFNIMDIDKYAKIFVSELDFEEDARRLINRKFTII